VWLVLLGKLLLAACRMLVSNRLKKAGRN